jgi:hypothetical protein
MLNGCGSDHVAAGVRTSSASRRKGMPLTTAGGVVVVVALVTVAGRTGGTEGEGLAATWAEEQPTTRTAEAANSADRVGRLDITSIMTPKRLEWFRSRHAKRTERYSVFCPVVLAGIGNYFANCGTPIRHAEHAESVWSNRKYDVDQRLRTNGRRNRFVEGFRMRWAADRRCDMVVGDDPSPSCAYRCVRCRSRWLQQRGAPRLDADDDNLCCIHHDFTARVRRAVDRSTGTAVRVVVETAPARQRTPMRGERRVRHRRTG